MPNAQQAPADWAVLAHRSRRVASLTTEIGTVVRTRASATLAMRAKNGLRPLVVWATAHCAPPHVINVSWTI
jgi:hypothetical protein